MQLISTLFVLKHRIFTYEISSQWNKSAFLSHWKDNLCIDKYHVTLVCMGFCGGSVVKKLPANAENMNSIPGSGRSPEEGNDNLLQYFAWEIPWTGALQAIVHGLTKELDTT